MNKRGKNLRLFRFNFFPKNKRGQFFLMMSLVIIGLVAGLTGISNSVQEKTGVKFYRVSEELKYESDKAMDYAIINNLEMKEVLTNFSKDYSQYSNADEFYYIFGDTTEITFVGLNKKNSWTVVLDTGTPQNIVLTQNQFNVLTVLNPNANIKITANGINYPFTLRQGKNFYFVVLKEIEGDVYTTTNG